MNFQGPVQGRERMGDPPVFAVPVSGCRVFWTVIISLEKERKIGF